MMGPVNQVLQIGLVKRIVYHYSFMHGVNDEVVEEVHWLFSCHGRDAPSSRYLFLNDYFITKASLVIPSQMKLRF